GMVIAGMSPMLRPSVSSLATLSRATFVAPSIAPPPSGHGELGQLARPSSDHDSVFLDTEWLIEYPDDFLDRETDSGTAPLAPMVPSAGEMAFDGAARCLAVNSCLAAETWLASLAGRDRADLMDLALGSATLLAVIGLA